MFSFSSGDHAHDVGFLHDDQLFAVELDLGTGPFAEQHAVSRFNVQWMDLAVVAARARAGGHNLALHRLFLCRVGNDDAAFALLFLLDAPDHHPVVQWAKLHEYLLGSNLDQGISTLSPRVL